MNIFDKFSKEIKNLISDNKENLKIKKNLNMLFQSIYVQQHYIFHYYIVALKTKMKL